jgi:hypothetical protein
MGLWWKGKKRIEEQIILKYEINQINYFFCLFLRLISTYLQKIKTEMAAKDKYIFDSTSEEIKAWLQD